MTAPMSDRLFTGYGEPTPPRQRHAPEIHTAVNHGAWHLVLRKGKAPEPLAHKLRHQVTTITVRGKQQIVALEEGQRWEGAWTTACGLVGAVLDLPETTVQVCPVCRDRPSTHG